MKKIILLIISLVFFAVTVWSQTRVITGQVLSFEKDTIKGAIVYQEGTTNGVLTDEYGNFSLTISDTGKVDLYFGYPGFVSLLFKEIPMAGDKIDLSKIFLGQEKIISKKDYRWLNKAEKRQCFPIQMIYTHSTSPSKIPGYFYYEVEIEVKCISESSIVNKFKFDKEKGCRVVEFKNYKTCP